MVDSIWRSIQRTNFTSLEKLAEFLDLSEEQKKQIYPDSRFVLNLPVRLAEKIAKKTLDDPVLRQFLPTRSETHRLATFSDDPVQDLNFRRTPKLLHKYNGRVLLVCTSACAMHCRYCFRQNFEYEVKEKGFEAELSLIAEDPSIKEVILSGGDPLSLSDERLGQLITGIKEIPHIKRMRIHTRFPIGIPERIDPSFLKLFRSLPFQVFFVVHVNHVNELDEEILARLNSLRTLGIILLNQSVLLKDINDDAETLCLLFETLANHGILPYYLNQLDKVQGASHFEVPIERGKALLKEVARRLPGYAIPKYVQDLGPPNKTVIL